jgi:ATP-dependent Zn protease
MHLFIFVVHYHFHLYCSSYTSKGNLKYLDVSLANFQIPTRTFVARVSIYKFFFFFFFFFLAFLIIVSLVLRGGREMIQASGNNFNFGISNTNSNSFKGIGAPSGDFYAEKNCSD